MSEEFEEMFLSCVFNFVLFYISVIEVLDIKGIYKQMIDYEKMLLVEYEK